MLVVVLTGGIGAGKSAAAAYFERRGALVVDADEVARGLMAPGSSLLSRVASEFGPQVVDHDGALNRAELARTCFGDPQSARRLDAIVHPAVVAEVLALLGRLDASPERPAVVAIEVPLLVEAPSLAEKADIVIAFEAAESVRADRAVARGMESDDVLRRIAVQSTDSDRAKLADVVISNDGTEAELYEELDRLWSETALRDCGPRG